MVSLTAITLCDVIHGQWMSGLSDRVLSGGIGTDSRAVVPDMAFFALSGDHFDGNAYAGDASRKGAGVVVVSVLPDDIADFCGVILVPDVLVALQTLATWWRGRLSNLEVVGITGSSGKTSTKDLTRSVLSQAFKLTATRGNLNNHIGVPLSILRAEPSDQVAIWEMGMNHAGELAPLCQMVQPRIGLISSIGSAHIEYLGTRDAIAVEKCTLARSLPADGAMIYPLSCDYAKLIESSTLARCIGVGIGLGGEQGVVRAENLVLDQIGSSFRLVIDGYCDQQVRLPLYGEHMVSNALLAAATGWFLGLTPQQIVAGLESVNLTVGRLTCEMKDGILVIDDTYNANPESMAAALKTLATMECRGKRWAVLGKMGELGTHARAAHQEVGRLAGEYGINYLIGVGSDARAITEGITTSLMNMKIQHFDTKEEASNYLSVHLDAGDAVLFKGSRSAGMEQLIQLIFNNK
ncbi:MAG: UDP-N-acetylmuramoyl-tripeptide--D-alanyl-D-alanine ligase [Akkermansia sp.]